MATSAGHWHSGVARNDEGLLSIKGLLFSHCRIVQNGQDSSVFAEFSCPGN